MSLTQDQATKLTHWLNTKTRPICPSCGNNPRWQAGAPVMMPMTRGNMVDMTSGVEVIPVTCPTCGYVRLYSTSIIFG